MGYLDIARAARDRTQSYERNEKMASGIDSEISGSYESNELNEIIPPREVGWRERPARRCNMCGYDDWRERPTGGWYCGVCFPAEDRCLFALDGLPGVRRRGRR
jgi:hypothetical protein